MKRGSVVIAAQRGDFTGKPRPWLVIQRGAFLLEGGTVTVCMISAGTEGSEFRVAVSPSVTNGLEAPSIVQADRVATIRWNAIDRVIGELDRTSMDQLDEALRLWLDL